jgi:hypothetical protein
MPLAPARTFALAALAVLALAITAPIAQASPHSRFFLSPSHNISCEVDVGVAGIPEQAYCQTMSPRASATLTASGKLKTCHGTRCIGNPPEHDPTLAYGRSFVSGPFRCVSRASGVTCLAGKRGFTISRAGVAAVR